MIKGGGSIHAQHVADAYIMNNSNMQKVKKNGNMQMNPSFNQSKYISGNVSHHGQSQSPASQTFFKDNSSKSKNGSLVGKKGWPSLKNKNK